MLAMDNGGKTRERAKRCILAVFAHPDDETSGAGGTFIRYAREGVQVFVVVATRGELGTLGAGGLVVAREELPAVREAELRSVLRLLGAEPPIFLGYRDQEVSQADFRELVDRVKSLMEELKPDRVITFGPTGISGHEDHKAMHRATLEAFHQYRKSTEVETRLLYPAIPLDLARQFDLEIEGPEVEPNVAIDVAEHMPLKLRALRTYRSQEDAQELAELFEQHHFTTESFHQIYPPVAGGAISSGFWE